MISWAFFLSVIAFSLLILSIISRVGSKNTLHVTVTWLLRGIGFYERRMRTSLDTQLLGLTEQGYRTVELYNGPRRIIKRNALFRAVLFNNGVYYYFFQEVKQLQNEIDKLSRLRHPRIVRFHGSEQKGDVIYLFLDFMAGVRVF